MGIRTSNKNASQYVEERKSFVGSNTEGTWENDNVYAVYSYGKHFPMFVFTLHNKMWYKNSDKYSSSTSKQQTQLHPGGLDMEWADTKELQNLIKSF